MPFLGISNVSLVRIRINKAGKVCKFCWCEYLHFIQPEECTRGVQTEVWVGEQHLCANNLKPVYEACLREGQSPLCIQAAAVGFAPRLQHGHEVLLITVKYQTNIIICSLGVGQQLVKKA